MSDKKTNVDVKDLIAETTISQKAIDNLIEGLPSKFSSSMTKSIINVIDGMKNDYGMKDDEIVVSILDNLNYIKDIKGVTFERYCTALRFVSMVLNGTTAVDAWKTIYPEKTKMGYTQERMIRWAGAYANNKLVSTLKASMMVSFSIQYSHFRHAAIKATYDLMNGKARTSKVPMYCRDPKNGKILRDKDGQMMYLRDERGEIMFEEIFQVVTPKIQQDAAATLLDITKPPEEMLREEQSAISKDERAGRKALLDAFDDIAKRQREAVLAGASIDDVQKIGDIIETHIVDAGEEED